ncbi:hypothetical protein M3Y97_00674400 [Aphelenchoides bicaudatus]|nr:hypothetical protein M3Y97_00674400 [Aphelenchoides bicaudatus]
MSNNSEQESIQSEMFGVSKSIHDGVKMFSSVIGSSVSVVFVIMYAVCNWIGIHSGIASSHHAIGYCNGTYVVSIFGITTVTYACISVITGSIGLSFLIVAFYFYFKDLKKFYTECKNEDHEIRDGAFKVILMLFLCNTFLIFTADFLDRNHKIDDIYNSVHGACRGDIFELISNVAFQSNIFFAFCGDLFGYVLFCGVGVVFCIFGAIRVQFTNNAQSNPVDQCNSVDHRTRDIELLQRDKKANGQNNPKDSEAPGQGETDPLNPKT